MNYCKAACGTLGQSGEKCTFICPSCKTKCHGKYAKGLKESIGKVPFVCKCPQKIRSFPPINNSCNSYQEENMSACQPPCKLMKIAI